MLRDTVPGLPEVPVRFGFAFSADGRWATCLNAAGDRVALERWSLDGAVPARRVVGAADRDSRPLPLNDGRVLVARTAPGGGHGSVVALPDGTRTWPVSAMLAGYLLASPGSPQTVVLVTVEDERHSRIWALSDASLEPVLRIPGVLSGGVWLDEGNLLAFDHAGLEHRADGIVVDLRERTWRRVWSVSDTTTDRIAACSRRARVLAVTTGVPGGQRIGLWSPGGGPVRFPEALNRSGFARTPLTFDESGEHLLVSEVCGATTRLLVHTPAGDRVEPVAGPPGTLWPPASWTGERIHVRFSAPHQPPTLATVHRRARSGWSLARQAPDPMTAWADADLVELPGPDGPIEAIVYGGPRWRECPRVVLALHGGPLAAWRFEFEPLFQHLALAGVAVVAPNYRGSTGYGEQHMRAVVGDWGGPDLADVVHLGRAVAGPRREAGLPGPLLLGGSYGGYLALLAACRSPRTWSGCVALAPFTSPAGLHRDADAPVRDRVARLNGPGDDERRDVLRECAALTAPLLLAHGTRDELIPVAQSRALRKRLLELGRTEGIDFDYLEVDDGHTAVVQAWPSDLRTNLVRFCLAAERIAATGQERR
ncbi:S9 family peptidase [Actinomadura macrotermitis]|uniref:S9 family peptidase n=1 Tax=Actinomadura macrotermitis TaxID=2585200 RepID=UPI001886924A|nr:alpha/beta fold hydrolase [Actinomadura macrotermitis]